MSQPDPFPRALRIIAIVVFAVYGAIFLAICAAHVRWPGFTEPMEGDVLQHIERVARFESPYVAPSGEYIPLSYMPLYYVAAAPFFLTFGDNLMGPRLLSCLCAVASGLIVAWMAWRESRDRTVALLAGAFFFAAYRVMDGCLTCALPDALLLFWLLLGFAFFAYGTKPRHDVAWLVLMSLAFWTKQQGALFFAGMVAYALVYRRNHVAKWAIVAGFLIGCPGAYLAARGILGSWFTYYTFVLPSRWERRLMYSAPRTVFLLAVSVPVALLLASAYWRATVSKLRVPPLSALLVITLASASYTMMAGGSSNNHYVPFVAVLCVASAVGLQVIVASGPPRGFSGLLLATCVVSILVFIVSSRTNDGHELPAYVVPIMAALSMAIFLCTDAARRSPARRTALAAVLIAANLATWYYDVVRNFPPAGSEAAIGHLQSDLAGLPGETVWITYGNVPAVLTGRQLARSPSWVAIEDLDRQQDPTGGKDALVSGVRRRLARVDFVLSDSRFDASSTWGDSAKDFVLERDYGSAFSAIRQIAYHWYSGGSYPRFLYRRTRPSAADSTQ